MAYGQVFPDDYYKTPPPGAEDEPPTYEQWCAEHGVLPDTAPDAGPGYLRLTDAYGKQVVSFEQPLPGSVVLTMGPHGTAWQRHFSDLLWHRTGGGRARTWRELSRECNLVLVYAAAVRS